MIYSTIGIGKDRTMGVRVSNKSKFSKHHKEKEISLTSDSDKGADTVKFKEVPRNNNDMKVAKLHESGTLLTYEFE